jgi:predicted RNase H-like HicB family nuclease
VVLDLVVTKSDDGFSTEIPSINGCESWAHNEDAAINNTLEMFRFYIQVASDFKIKIDKARIEGNKTIYKIIFDKTHA